MMALRGLGSPSSTRWAAEADCALHSSRVLLKGTGLKGTHALLSLQPSCCQYHRLLSPGGGPPQQQVQGGCLVKTALLFAPATLEYAATGFSSNQGRSSRPVKQQGAACVRGVNDACQGRH
jgi:hypothetical protein